MAATGTEKFALIFWKGRSNDTGYLAVGLLDADFLLTLLTFEHDSTVATERT